MRTVLLACVCACATSVIADFVFDSSAYVADGLVVQFDGIDNAGRGNHDGATNRWVDLTGNGYDLTNRTAQAATVVWPWDANSFNGSANIANFGPVTGPFNLDWSKVTYNFFDDLTLQKGYLISHYNDSLYFRQNGTTATSYQLYILSNLSVAYGTYTSGAHAVRGTGSSGENPSFWSESTGFKFITTPIVPDVASRYLYMLAHSNDANNWTFKTNFYAFRLYSRPLLDMELRWNAFVDRVRFKGDTPDSDHVTLLVDSVPSGYGASSPAYGSHTTNAGASVEFDISGSLETNSYDIAKVLTPGPGDGIRGVFLGWTLRNGNVVTNGTEETVTLTPTNYMAGFTWNFEKQYRVLANATAGGKVSRPGCVAASTNIFWGTADSNVTFTAAADVGYSFFCWSGDLPDDVNGKEATLALSADQVRNVIAVFAEDEHTPVTLNWKASVNSGQWYDSANWVEGAIPQAGDTVYITNKISNANFTIDVDAATPRLGKLVIGNDSGSVNYKTSLVPSKWSDCIAADEITIKKWGVIKCTGPFVNGAMSNRVWLAGNTLTIDANGLITANDAGWAALNGPAWRNHSSGQYGTSSCYAQTYGGETGYGYTWPEPYGDAKWPFEPGSGSGDWNAPVASRGPGGGAVFLDFTGEVCVDGSITADAVAKVYAYGSGGAVLVKCNTITGSGTIQVLAGSTTVATCGGSGRIAVHYNPTAQSNTVCSVKYQAIGGVGADLNYVDGTLRRSESDRGDREDGARKHFPGSLWFPDNQFLLHSETYKTLGYPFAGTWYSDEPLPEIHWTEDRTLSGTQLYFDRDGFRFTIDGNLTMSGSGKYARLVHGLIFTNAEVTVNGDLTLNASRMELIGGKLKVTGNVETSYSTASKFGGGEIALYPMPTNAPDAFGVQAEIDGLLHISNYSALALFCHISNGAIPHVKVGNVTIDEGGRIDASMKGYGSGMGAGARTGSRYYGGAYGGRGGISAYGTEASRTLPYGDLKKPLAPGSGNSYLLAFNGRGGGVVYLEVAKNIVLNGTIEADGSRYNCGYYDWYPGSSGGGVYLVAKQLTGVGKIYARGGHTTGNTAAYSYGAAGGGGRVAIITRFPDTLVSFTNTNVSVEHGVAWQTPEYGGAGNGTIYLGTLPAESTLILIR